MRIIFSRKGFDTGSGGAPSPIINGRPLSLPIPTKRRSTTSYELLGLGDLVERVTRGRIQRDHLCHEDPMFIGGRCVFGQCGAAQTHLMNQGVRVGDIFLFFGLFADPLTSERHHRIYGYLRVERVISLAGCDDLAALIGPLPRPHPHTLGEWNANNTLYHGAGGTARADLAELRLTAPGEPLRHWRIPAWLGKTGLSYHRNTDRWFAPGRLEIVARG